MLRHLHVLLQSRTVAADTRAAAAWAVRRLLDGNAAAKAAALGAGFLQTLMVLMQPTVVDSEPDRISELACVLSAFGVLVMKNAEEEEAFSSTPTVLETLVVLLGHPVSHVWLRACRPLLALCIAKTEVQARMGLMAIPVLLERLERLTRAWLASPDRAYEADTTVADNTTLALLTLLLHLCVKNRRNGDMVAASRTAVANTVLHLHAPNAWVRCISAVVITTIATDQPCVCDTLRGHGVLSALLQCMQRPEAFAEERREASAALGKLVATAHVSIANDLVFMGIIGIACRAFTSPPLTGLQGVVVHETAARAQFNILCLLCRLVDMMPSLLDALKSEDAFTQALRDITATHATDTTESYLPSSTLYIQACVVARTLLNSRS